MKVLIISHNPISAQHSIGKTLRSLFFRFNPEEVCQLYINGCIPEKGVCSSFFRITDRNVLKGVWTRKVKGEIVNPFSEQQNLINKKKRGNRKQSNSIKNRKPHRELLRDLIWALSPWYNKKLKGWIESEKPTCIFLAIGSGKFLYEMALKISKDYQIPIFTYICDDFYSINTPKTFFGPLWKKLIKKKTQKLFEKSKALICISEELSRFYRQEFNKPTVTIMTGTNYTVASNIKLKENIKTIRYFGKLTINRYKSIAEICRIIDEINREEDKDYSLEIYCGDVWEDVEKEFLTIRSAKFYPFITGEEFQKTFFSSEALLHVEAFDEISINRVKHSVSTKIADSLASGIPLFAYGPANVSSVQHLLRNRSGIVVTSKEDLKRNLQILFSNKAKREEIVKQEIITAQQYHNPNQVSEQLYKLLSQ